LDLLFEHSNIADLEIVVMTRQSSQTPLDQLVGFGPRRIS